MKRFLAACRLILTLNCEQSSHLVSESLDRELSSVERWAARLHQIGCKSCRRFAHQVRLIRQAIRRSRSESAPTDPHLSAEATQRIQQALQDARRSEG